MIEVDLPMTDVNGVLDQLVEEFESGADPDIASYVRQHPEHREELLDFWVVLSTSSRLTDEEFAESLRDTLSDADRDSVRDLLLAASLGPELLERADEERDDQAAKIGAELERLRAISHTFPGKAPITFRRMAVYAWITGILTEEAGYGVSRLRVQKVAYLLEHGLSLGIFRKHAKHPYGPYDPSLTYRDAEPGCLKEGYLQKSDGGLLEPGPKLAKAQNYALRYLREESVARALVLHVSGLDEWSLETLTTVHSVVAEMARSTVDAKAVSQAIRADAKWQSKLHRDNFTTKRIVEALRVLSLLRMA